MNKEIIVKRATFGSVKIIELKRVLVSTINLKAKLMSLKVSVYSLDLILNDIRDKIHSLENIVSRAMLDLLTDVEDPECYCFGETEDLDDNMSPLESKPNITHLSSFNLKQGYLILNRIRVDKNGKFLERKNIMVDLSTGQVSKVTKARIERISPVSEKTNSIVFEDYS